MAYFYNFSGYDYRWLNFEMIHQWLVVVMTHLLIFVCRAHAILLILTSFIEIQKMNPQRVKKSENTPLRVKWVIKIDIDVVRGHLRSFKVKLKFKMVILGVINGVKFENELILRKVWCHGQRLLFYIFKKFYGVQIFRVCFFF